MIVTFGSVEMKNYYRLFRGHKRPWKFVTARILMATGLCRLLTIRLNGLKIHFHPSNIAMSLWIDPRENDRDLAFIKAYLRQGDFVVDVGANIGQTVLVSSK